MKTTRFHRELLPPPKTFYEHVLGELARPDRKGWTMANCPFHNSRSRRSFGVNLVTGAFHCFGCDVHGGDLISFVMQHDRCSFKQACQYLDCWDDAGKRIKLRPGPLVRYLVLDFVIDGVRYRTQVVDEPRNELALLRCIHAEGKDRLIEIRHGDRERFENEEIIQWAIVADSWELIQMEVGR